jgi:hypothetical protein
MLGTLVPDGCEDLWRGLYEELEIEECLPHVSMNCSTE